MARPAGFEPATLGLEGQCAIPVSYGRERHNDIRGNWAPGWSSGHSAIRGLKLTMPKLWLGAAKSFVDDFFWSRWRFKISVFDLVSVGRGERIDETVERGTVATIGALDGLLDATWYLWVRQSYALRALPMSVHPTTQGSIRWM